MDANNNKVQIRIPANFLQDTVNKTLASNLNPNPDELAIIGQSIASNLASQLNAVQWPENLGETTNSYSSASVDDAYTSMQIDSTMAVTAEVGGFGWQQALILVITTAALPWVMAGAAATGAPIMAANYAAGAGIAAGVALYYVGCGRKDILPITSFGRCRYVLTNLPA